MYNTVIINNNKFFNSFGDFNMKNNINNKHLNNNVAKLESHIDYLESEINYLDTLLYKVGFPEGISSLKESAEDLLSERLIDHQFEDKKTL